MPPFLSLSSLFQNADGHGSLQHSSQPMAPELNRRNICYSMLTVQACGAESHGRVKKDTLVRGEKKAVTSEFCSRCVLSLQLCGQMWRPGGIQSPCLGRVSTWLRCVKTARNVNKGQRPSCNVAQWGRQKSLVVGVQCLGTMWGKRDWPRHHVGQERLA